MNMKILTEKNKKGRGESVVTNNFLSENFRDPASPSQGDMAPAGTKAQNSA
jgi:hypothetical protein